MKLKSCELSVVTDSSNALGIGCEPLESDVIPRREKCRRPVLESGMCSMDEESYGVLEHSSRIGHRVAACLRLTTTQRNAVSGVLSRQSGEG